MSKSSKPIYFNNIYKYCISKTSNYLFETSVIYSFNDDFLNLHHQFFKKFLVLLWHPTTS